MTVRTIVKHPDPVLDTVCEDVTDFDAQLAELAADMQETMVAARGMGLAAPAGGCVLARYLREGPGPGAIHVQPGAGEEIAAGVVRCGRLSFSTREEVFGAPHVAKASRRAAYNMR